MKKALLAFFYLAAIGQSSYGQDLRVISGIEEMNPGAYTIVTMQLHEGWLDWFPTDEYVVFASDFSGTENVWRLRVADLDLVEMYDGIFKASFLLQYQFASTAEQLTFETERKAINPAVSPDGNAMLYQAFRGTDSVCEDYAVQLLDLESRTTTPLAKERWLLYDFLSPETVIYVPYEQDSLVMKLNLITKEVSEWQSFNYPISGLQVGSEQVLLNGGGEVHAVRLADGKRTLLYEGEVLGTRLNLTDSRLVATLPAISTTAGGYVNLNTDEVTVLMNGLSEPVVSHNGEFVVVKSEFIQSLLVFRLE
ncbi:MAG TPA: hypothetical protein DCE41_08110 [Cytophagales bacterium]|nr:hypothetical protein [Cytophagales bacterium]HAA22384.1 hypothetical protein [Cytophagales bacterium]HAP64510.1 hypothetical protein [Cytophagales bacterium]